MLKEVSFDQDKKHDEGLRAKRFLLPLSHLTTRYFSVGGGGATCSRRDPKPIFARHHVHQRQQVSVLDLRQRVCLSYKDMVAVACSTGIMVS